MDSAGVTTEDYTHNFYDKRKILVPKGTPVYRPQVGGKRSYTLWVVREPELLEADSLTQFNARTLGVIVPKELISSWER